ncbi:MAG TPA: filamentous hemagglutinin N-terminal domain-containing protein, partial [Stellaceae bacterium]|nr:filamentous hemagglutinin N-terminal domain-containing protein [Stellaceae bacterium]
MPGVALAALALGAGHGEAQLVGGHVTGGQATINALSPTSTVINQQSQNASFRWQSFSIPAGSAVAFRQPSTSSIALNTVTGGSASAIYGSLTANGHVWLINPNGIVVGPSAQVTAAGVLLSTIGTSDQDFMAGNYAFNTPGHSDAAIVNHGHVVATSGGSVVMVAPQVRNDGLVEADLGTVVLAGAKAFTVDFAGDALLKFAITKPVDAVPVGTKSLVTNTGTVAASGGTVLMTAQAAQGVLDNVINTSGIVEATSVAQVGGTIVLAATGGGTTVSGTLDASGTGTGEAGGTVAVLGDSVTLTATARVNVSGDSGGGTALVGGNLHGAGPQQNAASTTVAQGAVIDASAIASGNGGTVAVWADDRTRFDGAIIARGGLAGGNGGFVETSGREQLSVQTGSVDTSAPHGSLGTWLLDPTDITVASGISGAIDPATLGAASSNVLLQAANDITFDNGVFIGAAGVGITARAGNSITVAPGAEIDTNGGNITLSANDPTGPASGRGSIVIDATLSTAGVDPIHSTLV